MKRFFFWQDTGPKLEEKSRKKLDFYIFYLSGKKTDIIGIYWEKLKISWVNGKYIVKLCIYEVFSLKIKAYILCVCLINLGECLFSMA